MRDKLKLSEAAAEPRSRADHGVGLLGGGVIGGGWAARFLLNGVDVGLFDPDPEAPRKVGEVLANARRARTPADDGAAARRGHAHASSARPRRRSPASTSSRRARPSGWTLKQRLLAARERAAGPDVVFGSSTSGLLPTEMQARHGASPSGSSSATRSTRSTCCRWSRCAAARRHRPRAVERAADVYRVVGMRPLVLSTEIDGFVADRLLEALWREALWLVNDGVATAEEIDDAIRFGAGLRWSFMGTFLIYRIAGGEAGMRHFMAQFGPALQWPWTKLMDVPELTDELLDRLVAQSRRAGGRPVDPRARGAARRLPGRGDAGPAHASASAPERTLDRLRTGAVRPRPRASPSMDLSRADRSTRRADRPDRVGRLQRPHQRQPLHAALQRGRSTASCASSASTRRT